MAKGTVKVNGVDTVVEFDMKKGIEFLLNYHTNRNPLGLNDLALSKINNMKRLAKSDKGITGNQMAYAKLLFMKVIVPQPLTERIETVRCVHAEVVENKMVRCDEEITATRKELAERKSLCEEHLREYVRAQEDKAQYEGESNLEG